MAHEVESQSRRGAPSRRSGGGLRPLHTLALAALAVVGVVIAFGALSFIVGIVWGIVKVAVIVVVIGGFAWLFLGRRRRRR